MSLSPTEKKSELKSPAEPESGRQTEPKLTGQSEPKTQQQKSLLQEKELQSEQDWLAQKEKGSPIALAFIVGFFKILGPKLTHFLTYFIVWFYYLTDAAKRGYIRDYLSQLHEFSGEKSPFKARPGFSDSMKLYQSFGETIVDRFTNWINPEAANFEFNWEGHELLQNQVDTGRGAIVMSGHFGNIEALRAKASGKNLPVKMLMFVENAQKYLKMLAGVNPKVMDHLICLKSMDIGNLNLLQNEIKQGNLIGILADRITPGAPGKVTQIRMLGKPASFPQGPFVLATILEVPVYTIFVIKTGPRKYSVQVKSIYDGQKVLRKERQSTIEAMQIAYKTVWEELCILYPYQWFNFFNFWKS
ncbi:MAG: hypothetical protein QNL04_15465 [SAR324 cluster bacterium]|nr:hypothetical protein [SAR324 cluster bacterium]